MSTITNTVTQTVTLGTVSSYPTYLWPLTVSSTGTIDVASGDGILGPANSLIWSVTNDGTVEAAGTGGVGIDLRRGGPGQLQIRNNANALISGYSSGIYTGGEASASSAFVTNQGIIRASGTAGVGVDLHSGGDVDNYGGSISGGIAGVYVADSGGLITNRATIEATDSLGTGVDLRSGGGVHNYGGSISGGSAGVYIKGSEGIVINHAVITANLPSGVGVTINAGTSGTVINSGTIIGGMGSSGAGIVLTTGSAFGRVVVAALVSAGGNGVYLNSAGYIQDTGTISGGRYGVYLKAGGTVKGQGTISGTTEAIKFGGTNRNVLELYPSYKLSGGVAASVSASNTLKISGNFAFHSYNNVQMVFNYNNNGVGQNGVGLAPFQNLVLGMYSDLLVSNTVGTIGVTVSGIYGGLLVKPPQIDLTAIGAPVGYTVNGSLLTITGSSGAVTFKLGPKDSHSFILSSDGAVGTDVTLAPGPACFMHRTRIATSHGDAAVEDLKIGDRVRTASGEARPIKWIGRRAYDGRFIADNRGVLPIRVMAGALSEGVPARDLFVSPEHCLVINGLFLPARSLVNGATIVQCDNVEHVEYFHIELDTLDVIFAEGAAAETFIDFGGRRQFHNADEFARLYPGAEPADWETYAALLDGGKAGLPVVRAALLDRALRLAGVSRDADLHLVADGNVVRAEKVDSGVHHFVLPASARQVALASRSVVPAETEAVSLDPRCLGVALEWLVLEGAGLRLEVDHSCDALRDGFHADEGAHRWTDGCASVPPELLACFVSEVAIEVKIGAIDLHYPVDASAQQGRHPGGIEDLAAQVG